MIEIIDLHMHTNVSDGTDTPSEILSRVREAGIELFAVTDHDAVRGGQLILQERKASDPHFLTGVEFSCKDEGGKYHILGYGYDPAAESVRALVEKGHALRMKKVRRRMELLSEQFGFQFPEEEIETLLRLENPGKPHIGNLMTKLGFTASKEEAIQKYINQVKLRSEYIRPEEAIRGILDGGGIPVLAHPSYGSGEELYIGPEMEERILHLLPYGLMGLEAYYSGFTNRLRDELLRYADRYELYVTAGSDYHGTNKLVLLGDTNLTRVSEAHEGVRRFLQAAADRIH